MKMEETFEEIDNMDLILTTKVIIRSEYPELLYKYYNHIKHESKDLSIDKIKIYDEMTNLMKEEKISSEFNSFKIIYNKQTKQIIINFLLSLKIDKKFLLRNELNSKVEIILDYNKKEIYYDISDIILLYYIGDENESYINLDMIRYKEHFILYLNQSDESKIKNLIYTFFIE